MTNTVADLIRSVTLSASTQNWYAALSVSLTLPDICSKCDARYNKLPSNDQRYGKWYDDYSGEGSASKLKREDFPSSALPGKAVYYLRCKFLHQALDSFKHPGKFHVDVGPSGIEISIDKISFMKPEPEGHGLFHENVHGNDFIIRIDVFCYIVCRGADLWLKDVTSDAAAQAEMSKMIRIHDKSELTRRGIVVFT